MNNDIVKERGLTISSYKTAEEILKDEDFLITQEVIENLKVKDLRILATKLFNIKGQKNYIVKDLRKMCIEALKKEMGTIVDPNTEIDEFLEKEQNQINAVNLAVQYRKAVGSNWFAVNEERKAQLEILILFKLAKKKVHPKKMTTKYKIIMTVIEKGKQKRLKEEQSKK